MLRSPITTTLLLLLVLIGLAGLVSSAGTTVHLPGNDQGYEPAQPIAFSHQLHAGELQIDCLYCHSGADKSRHAGIPAAGTCMNCHKSVRATFGAIRAEDEMAQQENRAPRRIVSPEIAKLYTALGLDPETFESDPAQKPTPIEWIQIHKLPDFVYFNHAAHVNAGVTCQECHGPVETMERVRQVADLSMGWCVNCHRDTAKYGVNGKPVASSTDCAVCHY
ncbi:MAG TPA: cytochrome c3 family protein [Phycisphaerae bacterium]|nr:cytochrome c3 family protein [Phycisphaerae bacterium]HOQ86345.1 cytochrome c3 family protein [Phycisphaerae bacterium]HPU26091.1 cytochrome c3 family protein [Phycisphaerae bacterium]